MLLAIGGLVTAIVLFVNIWLFPILHEGKPKSEGLESPYDKFVMDICFPTGHHHFVLSWFSFGFFKRSCVNIMATFKRKFILGKNVARYGQKAPTADIVTISGEACNLNDYFDKYQHMPLILNMGSYT